MHLLTKIALTIIIIVTAFAALYLFVWIALILLLVLPVAMLYWRRKWKKYRVLSPKYKK